MKKKYSYLMVFFTGLLLMGACKKEEQKKVGNPTVSSKTEIKSAHFGDSLAFTVDVADLEVPLSTVKAQLFFSDELVYEQVIRTKTDGEYSGKVYIPYFANVPNGIAKLKFVVQNINLTLSEESFDLTVERPDYPYLTLVTAEQEYRMERKGLYDYALETQLPAKVKGHIKAPTFGEDGNELTFGWESNAVVQGSTADIPFSNSSSGEYAITFNTFDFEASPFIIAYAINGTVMTRVDDEHFKIDLSLTKGQELIIDGIEDIEDWWLDADFIEENGPGKYTFMPQAGDYRITADFKLKYFVFEALDKGELATLQTDGTGAVWIIGEGIGKPSISTNQVGWNTDKALCLAPIGGKKYQVTVLGGTTINSNVINFKFFHQKGWGGEFKSPGISTTSDLILVGDGDNGRDSGNLGLVTDKTLEVGKAYVLTLDLSSGNDQAVLTVVEK